MFSRATVGWGLFGVVLLILILGPFFLFGEAIEQWTTQYVGTAEVPAGWLALVLGGLLAGDILLPTPSSLISTSAGYSLGFVAGALVSLLGMTASCLLGYWLGHRYGQGAARRFVGEQEVARLQRLSHLYGDWVLVVCRPIPVLAEASVLVAGVGHLPLRRFVWLSTFSNLGISLAYAAVGAFSATLNSFLLAFAGAIAVPFIAMLLMQRNLASYPANEQLEP